MNISNLELTGKVSRNLAILSFVILMSDELLDTLLWLIHGTIEIIEYSAEMVAEIILNTNDKQTEIIGFYLIMGAALYMTYCLYRALPRYCQQTKRSLRVTWLGHKKSMSRWWHTLSTTGKVELITFCIITMSLWLLV